MCSIRPLILMLEDDPDAAEALQLLLRDWGADVAYGKTAEQALAAAGGRAGSAAMIITDFHLGPDPDGVSLAQRLLKHAPGARVLVLSGSTSGAAQRAANQAGYSFLRKPAPAADIIAWMERA